MSKFTKKAIIEGVPTRKRVLQSMCESQEERAH
jgi:hypothetical protein